MPDGAHWTRPEGGFFCWLTLPDGADSVDVARRAVERGVAIVPGTLFFPDGRGTDTVRLSFQHGPRTADRRRDRADRRAPGRISDVARWNRVKSESLVLHARGRPAFRRDPRLGMSVPGARARATPTTPAPAMPVEPVALRRRPARARVRCSPFRAHRGVDPVRAMSFTSPPWTRKRCRNAGLAAVGGLGVDTFSRGPPVRRRDPLLALAPSAYYAYLAIHILSAVIWVGGDVTLTVLGIVFERRGEGETLGALGRMGAWIGTASIRRRWSLRSSSGSSSCRRATSTGASSG